MSLTITYITRHSFWYLLVLGWITVLESPIKSTLFSLRYALKMNFGINMKVCLALHCLHVNPCIDLDYYTVCLLCGRGFPAMFLFQCTGYYNYVDIPTFWSHSICHFYISHVRNAIVCYLLRSNRYRVVEKGRFLLIQCLGILREVYQNAVVAFKVQEIILH